MYSYVQRNIPQTSLEQRDSIISKISANQKRKLETEERLSKSQSKYSALKQELEEVGKRISEVSEERRIRKNLSSEERANYIKELASLNYRKHSLTTQTNGLEVVIEIYQSSVKHHDSVAKILEVELLKVNDFIKQYCKRLRALYQQTLI